MFFDDRLTLNHPHRAAHKNASPTGSASPEITQSDAADAGNPRTGRSHANLLDDANNRLQGLMQLLYLLSRDPAVPSDARYHVTLAQSEIALLANVMRNSAKAAVAGGQ